MEQALLILLLSLTGNPASPGSPASPSASHAPAASPSTAAFVVPRDSRGLTGAVLGAWTGTWTDAGAPPVPVEAAFLAGAKVGSFLAHFAFPDAGVRRSIRGYGSADAGGLQVVLPGGRRVVLRVRDAERLVGDVAAPHGSTPAASLTLSRLRR